MLTVHQRGIPAILLIFFLVVLTGGCARQTKVVLLAESDGSVGQLNVSTDSGSINMTNAMEATVVKGRQSVPSSPQPITRDEIEKDFAEALRTLPEQPLHFILYFKRDSNLLTPESETIIPEVLSAVEQRRTQDISVIGHTDTAGNPAYNLRLSNKRAEAIAAILLENGVPKSYIATTSHGENNPLVPTADNVHEPRNRRVEVVVR